MYIFMYIKCDLSKILEQFGDNNKLTENLEVEYK